VRLVEVASLQTILSKGEVVAGKVGINLNAAKDLRGNRDGRSGRRRGGRRIVVGIGKGKPIRAAAPVAHFAGVQVLEVESVGVLQL